MKGWRRNPGAAAVESDAHASGTGRAHSIRHSARLLASTDLTREQRMEVQKITDMKSFWGALGVRATGAAIITTKGESGQPSGFLALSATHLSASPPTMTVSVSPTTSAYPDIQASGHFAINYLSSKAGHVYERFAGRDAPKGAERFAGLDLREGRTGVPILAETTGALECRVVEVIERFGTALVIGEILWAHRSEGAMPMIHYQGRIVGLD
jgi:flavin reductase (DIM6/NTAB) family NADH-FMN oxidoreductase RutF